MKYAILNKAGKQGKTSLGVHLFSPRMKNAPIFSVETFNEDAGKTYAVAVSNYSGENFHKLYKDMLLEDDLIVDIGSSNIQDFLEGLSRYEDSHVEIDHWFIVTTSGAVEMKETIQTVNDLAAFGIPREKIHLIFNKVRNEVEQEFSTLFNFAKKEKRCVADPNAAVYFHEIFDILVTKALSIDVILQDESDYKALITSERAKGEKADAKLLSGYADMRTLQLGVKAMKRNLDTVFAAITA
jgi:hypothetical protein